MMKMIQHPNIVKLKEVLASNSKIYLVLELITGGDLFDIIKGIHILKFLTQSNTDYRKEWTPRG